MTAPKPPGGELSLAMLSLLVRLWSDRTVCKCGHDPTLDGLINRGLAELGQAGERIFASGKAYPIATLTLLGEQRVYWCMRGRLP